MDIYKGDLDTWQAPQDIRANFPYYHSGYDSDNRPIWVAEFGKWDIKSMLERGEKWEQDLDKYVNQWLWRMYNSTGLRATPENPVKEVICIVDYDGYDLQQLNNAKTILFVIKKMRLIAISMRFARGAYCVNTNLIGQNLMNILKPILGPDFEKIQIYGTNPSKYWPILIREIPKDQLPKWYGGTEDFKPVKIYG